MHLFQCPNSSASALLTRTTIHRISTRACTKQKWMRTRTFNTQFWPSPPMIRTSVSREIWIMFTEIYCFMVKYFPTVSSIPTSQKDNLQINLHQFLLFNNIKTSDTQTSHNLNFIKKDKNRKSSFYKNIKLLKQKNSGQNFRLDKWFCFSLGLPSCTVLCSYV